MSRCLAQIQSEYILFKITNHELNDVVTYCNTQCSFKPGLVPLIQEQETQPEKV
jgi:hypothetical protein